MEVEDRKGEFQTGRAEFSSGREPIPPARARWLRVAFAAV
jgi:hypothetical protein